MLVKSIFKIFYCLIFLSLSSSLAYSQYSYTIDDIPLTWRNFLKKDVGARSKVAAQTHVTIDIEYDIINSNNNSRTLKIDLRITQSRDDSWVSKQFLMKATDQASLDLLNHEKLHYVINLIGFKSLYNELKSARFTDDYKSEITSIFRKHSRQIDRMNADYDKQTYHGTSKKNQTKWEKQVMDNFNDLYATDKSIRTEYSITTQI